MRLSGDAFVNSFMLFVRYISMRCAPVLLFLILSVFLGSCGRSLGDLLTGRDVSEISDYGSDKGSTQSGGELDPELEAFWSEVLGIADQLPSREASRLIVNLKELRTRFDRATASVIAQAARRFLPSGALTAFMEEGTLELGLLLEQRSGEALLSELEIFISTPPEHFGEYLSSSVTAKPEGEARDQIQEGEKLIDLLVAPPVMNPNGGSFVQLQEVKLFSATAGAVIHYTLDNSEPNELSPTYTKPLWIGASEPFTVIRAIAIHPERGRSELSIGTFSINLDLAQIPQSSHESKVYSADVVFTLTSPEAKSVIHYTVDGSLPTEQSPIYTSPFLLGEGDHLTLKARAYVPGKRPSPVVVRDIRVDKKAPVSIADEPLRFENILPHTFTVFWEPAFDDFTPADEILYRIVVATSSDEIGTLDDASRVTQSCSSASPPCVSGLLPSQPGVGFHARGLRPSTDYQVALLAFDAAGNRSFLGVAAVSTIAEGNLPPATGTSD